jgi:hypothetical protein
VKGQAVFDVPTVFDDHFEVAGSEVEQR